MLAACRRIAEMIGGPSGRPSSTDEAADQAEGTGGAVSSGSSSSSSDETDRNDEASSTMRPHRSRIGTMRPHRPRWPATACPEFAVPLPIRVSNRHNGSLHCGVIQLPRAAPTRPCNPSVAELVLMRPLCARMKTHSPHRRRASTWSG